MKKTAKGIAAAVAAAALTALGTVAPALAEAVPARPAAVVARRHVSSPDAIAAAVRATGLTWSDVEGVEWHADKARGAYAITLETVAGDKLRAFVDTATGEARAALPSADAISAAVTDLGLSWAGVEGVEWHLDRAGDYAVTLLTTAGTERAATVDACTGAVRVA